MTFEKITSRVIVPKTGLRLKAALEAVWLRAVKAAVAEAMQPLERCAPIERLAATSVLWNNDLPNAGKAFLFALKAGRLQHVQRVCDKLRRPITPQARVLIAYANLWCRSKQVPTVKKIQAEIRCDGKARGERYIVPGHSGVRFILDSADLPKASPGSGR